MGNPRVEDFSVATVAMPVAGPGELLVETIWLSLDPLIRFALDEKPLTDIARVGLGEPLYGGTVSRVVESNHPEYRVGDHVEGRSGWREYAAVDPAKLPLRKIDPSIAPISTALGILGMPGQTAHACVIEIGRVQAGETMVISAAGGGGRHDRRPARQDAGRTRYWYCGRACQMCGSGSHRLRRLHRL